MPDASANFREFSCMFRPPKRRLNRHGKKKKNNNNNNKQYENKRVLQLVCRPRWALQLVARALIKAASSVERALAPDARRGSGDRGTRATAGSTQVAGHGTPLPSSSKHKQCLYGQRALVLCRYK